MNIDRVGVWRKDGVVLGKVYRLSKRDLGRVGGCWMNGRLHVGDLVMPIRHSGDCFYDYRLIQGGTTRENTRVMNAQGQLCYDAPKGAVFGAYSLGTLYEEQPTEEEYHLLMAGVHTAFSDRLDVKNAEAERREDAEKELFGTVDRAIQRMEEES